MINIHETKLEKDLKNKRIYVTREFNAPVEKLWKAWTESEITDQWWAPKPWRACTVSQDFKPGGTWLYYMEGPAGERHYCRADYKNIVPQKSYEVIDAFCDENGNINTEHPRMNWNVEFLSTETGSKVQMVISFDKEEDLKKILEMGFQEGFTAALGNLDEIFAK